MIQLHDNPFNLRLTRLYFYNPYFTNLFKFFHNFVKNLCYYYKKSDVAYWRDEYQRVNRSEMEKIAERKRQIHFPG